MPGILHERSGSGASFFIEPMATVELNNDLADLLIQEREEIARITRYISQLLFDDAAEIITAVDTGDPRDLPPQRQYPTPHRARARDP